jgi:hypothetical protein
LPGFAGEETEDPSPPKVTSGPTRPARRGEKEAGGGRMGPEVRQGRPDDHAAQGMADQNVGPA